MKSSKIKTPYASNPAWRAVLPTALAVAGVTSVAIGVVGVPQQSTSPEKSQRKTTDPPMLSRGKLGQDLFLAIDHRDLAEVKSLLSKGADPNSRNGLDFVPLYIASASHQLDVMKALISANAKADAESPYGTALTLASATGHTEGVSLLISKGANVNHVRVDGITPLMMAANAGRPDTVGELLKNKANPNLKNYAGATALAYAARAGNLEAGRLLLNAGAAVDTRDSLGETPLMNAAKAGRTDFVKMLLAKGAKVNVKDNQGRTPLLLATTYGDYPEVVKALKGAGANTAAKDAKGRTASVVASMHGYEGSASVLGVSAVKPKTKSASDALAQSLILMQRSMKTFGQKTACLSCHHEGVARMATALAGTRGFKIDPELQKAQAGRLGGATGAMLPLHAQALKNPEAMKQIPLIEMNEVSSGYSWLLSGMAAQNDKATAGTSAMASVLGRQQAPQGHWTFSLPRLPMQSSPFTLTALSIRSMNAYAPKAESDAANAKARAWMLNAPAATSDDLAFRLLGLKWAGATVAERQKSVEELLAKQLPDGGWAQMPGMPSDAYATGQALYALQAGGGVVATNPRVKKGLQFLLRTQDDDGSWFVSKRAIPANNYFDSDFPHGESQYSSFNATTWAVMALLEGLPRK